MNLHLSRVYALTNILPRMTGVRNGIVGQTKERFCSKLDSFRCMIGYIKKYYVAKL